MKLKCSLNSIIFLTKTNYFLSKLIFVLTNILLLPNIKVSSFFNSSNKTESYTGAWLIK